MSGVGKWHEDEQNGVLKRAVSMVQTYDFFRPRDQRPMMLEEEDTAPQWMQKHMASKWNSRLLKQYRALPFQKIIKNSEGASPKYD